MTATGWIDLAWTGLELSVVIGSVLIGMIILTVIWMIRKRP